MQPAVSRGTSHVVGTAGLRTSGTWTTLRLRGVIASLTLCKAECWVRRYHADPVGSRFRRCNDDSN
jgi:hypothetical protein